MEDFSRRKGNRTNNPKPTTIKKQTKQVFFDQVEEHPPKKHPNNQTPQTTSQQKNNKIAMNKKERLVAAIENGTVIDHIPADKTEQVVALLKLYELTEPVTIGNNYPSDKIGKKGIIKVSDKFFSDEEISRLSVVSPNVVLSIIQDYEVVEKKTVETPDELRGIIACNNPKCITNNEPMQSYFAVEKLKGVVRCHYCDKEQDIRKVKLC